MNGSRNTPGKRRGTLHRAKGRRNTSAHEPNPRQRYPATHPPPSPDPRRAHFTAGRLQNVRDPKPEHRRAHITLPRASRPLETLSHLPSGVTGASYIITQPFVSRHNHTRRSLYSLRLTNANRCSKGSEQLPPRGSRSMARGDRLAKGIGTGRHARLGPQGRAPEHGSSIPGGGAGGSAPRREAVGPIGP